MPSDHHAVGAPPAVSRRPLDLPRAQVEARRVQRALHHAALQPAVGQGSVLMRAGVVDRVKLAVRRCNTAMGVGPSTRTASPLGMAPSSQTGSHVSSCCILDNL